MIRVVRFSILILVTVIASAMISTTAAYADAIHVVRSGETLSAIAARYGTSIGAIQAANGINNPNQIIAGMTLVIPGAAYGQSSGSASPGYSYVSSATNSLPPQGGIYVSSKSAMCTTPYRAQPGDSLSGIAARCGGSPLALASANGLSPYAMLYVGQVLSIPAADSYASPSGSQARATSAPTRTNTYYPTLPATGGNSRPAATPMPPPSRPSTAGPTPTPRIEPELIWR